ncbi:MAG: alpha/beta hydrolase [Myxococcota bacterium]
MLRLPTLLLLAPLALLGCPTTGPADDEDPNTGEAPDTGMAVDTSETGMNVELPDVSDTITYRQLDTHPGCSTVGLSDPASIPGYTCAAKEFVGTEDTSKPIVLLIHGNSDSPAVFETFDPKPCDVMDKTFVPPDMLTEQLLPMGYRMLAVDMRFDLVDDDPVDNFAQNMDHGWGVPIVQHFLESVLEAYPDRQIAIVAHSFGVTVVRDAIRRLYINDGVDVFSRIDDMILLAGANHGVSTFELLCGLNPTMAGSVACEMGSRAAYSPTEFLTPNNGPEGAFETPCSTGESAFGRTDACNGHSVAYTTVVMQDKGNGEQQDLFVSEASSRLEGADNQLIGLQDFDISFYGPACGALANHYGAARAQAAIDIILARLAD